LGLGGALLALAAITALISPASSAVVRDDRFGVVHVSYPAGPRSDERYARAAAIGAAWDRWALYWTDVETSPGQYNWSNVDANVDADTANGFQIDPVLLNTPTFYSPGAAAQSNGPPPRLEDKGPALAMLRGEPLRRAAGPPGSPPIGLGSPVFADGTDALAPGKAINPNNPWARFVAAAVARYKDRVHYWEVWNEPDFSFFWNGSVADYARLLKVAYLAARSVDPSARILVGGMMYWQWANQYGDHAWLKAFLDELARDPAAAANGYYFDAIPWHWYSRSSDVYDKTTAAAALLASRGIAGKAQWVNEANAPACGEPQPIDHSCSPGGQYYEPGTATIDEQAAFVVQALAYGLAANADHVFQFQFQDDGNSEPFGLYRNDGTARPAYTAYGTAAALLAGATNAVRTTIGNVEQIAVTTPRGRTTVLWARGGAPETAIVDARGGVANLVELDGTATVVFPANGQYRVDLAAATDNRSFANAANDYIVGGKPRFLVETGGSTPVPTPLPGWLRTRFPVGPRNGALS
jgi:hypothetical protein